MWALKTEAYEVHSTSPMASTRGDICGSSDATPLILTCALKIEACGVHFTLSMAPRGEIGGYLRWLQPVMQQGATNPKSSD